MKLLVSLAAVLGLVGFSAGASAEECPRGTLDKQYCDRNNDLVADLPLDESKWVDPSTIIFSYTPVEDPAVYAKVWDGFVNHMLRRAREAGFKVLVVTVDVPVSSTRERQFRAGLSVPPRKDLRTLWRAAIRPAWTMATLSHRIPRLLLLESYTRGSENLKDLLRRVLHAGRQRQWANRNCVKWRIPP